MDGVVERGRVEPAISGAAPDADQNEGKDLVPRWRRRTAGWLDPAPAKSWSRWRWHVVRTRAKPRARESRSATCAAIRSSGARALVPLGFRLLLRQRPARLDQRHACIRPQGRSWSVPATSHHVASLTLHTPFFSSPVALLVVLRCCYPAELATWPIRRHFLQLISCARLSSTFPFLFIFSQQYDSVLLSPFLNTLTQICPNRPKKRLARTMSEQMVGPKIWIGQLKSHVN